MLRKSLWLLVIVMITLCAYLTSDFVTLSLKKIWSVPPRSAFIAQTEDKLSEMGTRDKKYYQVILQRDLFAIAASEDEKTQIKEEDREKDIPLTPLKLKLLGTMIGKGISPYAIIKDLQTRKQDIYKVGDMVGPAELIEILRNKVILRRNDTEEMLIAFESLEPPEADTSSPDESSPSPTPQMQASFRQQGIRERYSQVGTKVGTNHWALNRNDVQDVINNASQHLTQIRIIPHFKGGNLNEPDGFQVANIVPRSIFDKLGFQSGDIIRSVNGEIITNPEKAFEAYQKLKNEPRIKIKVLRNNKEIDLTYDINE